MQERIDRVDKLDVARRQLREAILLFFERRDPLAVHALTAAAHEIIRTLGRRKGVTSMIKDNPYVRDDKRKEINEIFNAAHNFMKHADRDPDAVFDFRPAATPIYIIDAIEMWTELTDRPFKEAFVFRIWFLLAHPHLVASQQANASLEPFRQQLGPNINDFAMIRKAIDEVDFGARVQL